MKQGQYPAILAEQAWSINNLLFYYLLNRPQVPMVYRLSKTTRDVCRIREEFVNDEPRVSNPEGKR